MSPTDDQIFDKATYRNNMLAQGSPYLSREFLIHRAESGADRGCALNLPNGWGAVGLRQVVEDPPVRFVIHRVSKGVAVL
ncbi:hypothetical protein GO998_17965 (plasmid) [Ralstonia syzygii]|uniref:Uncharacterized protein n=1 Tax=Ralstonia syzygii TaxID=28097 RepID=A0ABX7ZL07_9RALS|nr:hypothetical protein [Ralstonia syzygii]QUP55652.1 hypothetical protein GO998_17965 [Ralstonia syzygii]